MAAFCIDIVVLPISLVGLTETILSKENLDNLTDSTNHKNAEARGQCIGNIVSSPFGGMAGRALVEQSVMNVGCGGRKRLSTFSSGVNQIPIAILACMMMIAINTSN